jgi:outer membrane protein OmpA-like peptidoglycan-associated protein/tetratricopeptide (TPR) repeat protein
MVRNIALFSLYTIISGFIFSQTTPQEGCAEPPKKILKLITKTKEETELPKKIEGFMEAIQVGASYAMPFYEYGLYSFDDAMKQYDKGTANGDVNGDKQLVKAEGMFLKALGICENYHASLYYYLGVINYYQKENAEALKYMKLFQSFEDPDVKKYDNDHFQKLNDLKDIVIQLEEEQAIYNNPVPFNPILVKNVSSPNDEYFPMISPDNELMFYTRKGIRNNSIVEDFTYSTRPNMNSEFDAGQAFAKPFNDGSFDSYGSATMSVDNKEMIICACKDINSFGQKYRNCDLYITHFVRSGKGGNDYTWTPLENMGPNINDQNSWEAQPTLSADGNTLIYARNGIMTKDSDNDLFISRRDERGRWTKAMPLSELNTKNKDKSPFLHQDGETLYFVSSSTDERKGVGGTDIFVSKFDKKTKKWGRPKNLGYPINTKEDEIGLFVSTNGQLAYYSSKAEGSSFDVYAFELPQELRPDAVAIVKGELKDDQGNAIEGGVIEVTYSETGETEKIAINGNDGKYAAIVKLEQPQDVILTVKKDGHSFDTKTIAKHEIEKLKAFVKHEKEVLTGKPSSPNRKDSTQLATTPTHKDVLHTKTAQEHHTTQSNSETTTTAHKDVLHSKSAQNHQQLNENQNPSQNATSTSNSILDGSGNPAQNTTNSILDGGGNPAEMNSILDGQPNNSMVISNVNMTVQPLKVGMTYTINNILFATNSFELTPRTKAIIKEFSKFLSENPTIEITIQGHTDNQGDESKNKILSQNRANEVRNYLIELGIAADRMESIGFGSSQPKIDNSTEENRRINRRTDFLIKKL